MREMKDSGIEWVGAIPQDWKTDRLQWHLKEINVSNNPIQTKNILSLTIEAGVIPYAEKGNQGNKAKEDYCQYKIAFPDTLVINSMNVIIGAVGISQYFGCVSPVYYVFEPIEGTDLRYIYYLFTNTGFQKEMRKYAKGILEIRLRISSNDMLKRIVPSPPFKEQQRIADYLDKMCAEIDTVLEKTRASIEEYKKLKQAVITQAVTKGIRGDRPMKDSGIEWIGEISQDFEIVKLKWLCDVLDQFRSPVTADKRNQNADVLYDYYGASGAIDKIDGYTIDDHVMLIGEDGANLRMRNLPIMYEINGKAWVNNHAHILKPKTGVDFYFIFYALEALDLNYYITGSAQPKLSQDNLRNIWVPITDFTGQKRIAAYISDVCDEFDCLIAKKQQYLTEIENYKKSLIYEYVTGKKEVHPL